jgi:hypothetical protein
MAQKQGKNVRDEHTAIEHSFTAALKALEEEKSARIQAVHSDASRKAGKVSRDHVEAMENLRSAARDERAAAGVFHKNAVNVEKRRYRSEIDKIEGTFKKNREEAVRKRGVPLKVLEAEVEQGVEDVEKWYEERSIALEKNRKAKIKAATPKEDAETEKAEEEADAK